MTSPALHSGSGAVDRLIIANPLSGETATMFGQGILLAAQDLDGRLRMRFSVNWIQNLITAYAWMRYRRKPRPALLQILFSNGCRYIPASPVTITIDRSTRDFMSVEPLPPEANEEIDAEFAE